MSNMSKTTGTTTSRKGYWITVGLFGAAYTLSATMDLAGVGPAHATLAHLGYPAYVATILGLWKAAAVIALLVPRLPRVKEWAYAGIVFDLTGGLASHLFSGDPLPMPIVPIVFLALALASYALRPADRRLASAPATPAPAPAAPIATARAYA